MAFAPSLPKNSWSRKARMPIRSWFNGGEWQSIGSEVAMERTWSASWAVRAKMEMQSRDWQAGTTPVVLMRPRVGLRPMMLLRAAGTRPEPAVSVPREKVTRPAATATAEPELEPPEMKSELKALGTGP